MLICLCFSFKAVFAQDKKMYVLEKTIPLPGDGGFDYLFIDEVNRRLYVSHGTAVHVLDLETQQLVGTIENMQGVHGISIIPALGKGFITDGKANAVIVFDIHSLKILKSISLSGKKADAIMYDAFSDKILAFNGGSNNASVVDVHTLEEQQTIDLGGVPEFGVSDGKGKIYNNIEDRNKTVVIDARNFKILDSVLLTPHGGPTALSLDKNNGLLFIGCRDGNKMVVVDIKKKQVIATVPICKSVDAIVYDERAKLIFCSGDGSTTIIRQEAASKYAIEQTLETGIRAKTMAYDSKQRTIYISLADFEPGTKKIITGTFRLLVYGLTK